MTTVSTANEAQLIAQAQKGDRNAFSELVRVHAQGVLNVVYHLCGDMLIAEDAAQETFIRAWQNLPNYRPQTSLRNWLYRIAFNAGMDMIRKNRRIVPDDINEMRLADDQPSLEAAVAERERAKLVQGAILSLPDASRAVLVLREYEGLSYQEISSTLDIPVGTVMSRLNYARKLLKSKLEQNYLQVEAEYV